jgi:DNA-binding NarL/FixJ family response regulator
MRPYEEEEQDLVLIVDDTAETISILSEALEKEGMSTLVALDGNQALSIAKRMLPDIILLDALMPGIDGFETCKLIKLNSDLKSIPVIFMTGLTDSEHVVRGLEAGAVDYVTKPININEIAARIKVHITNSRVAMSAQSALDIAGQYVMTVTKNGTIVWSTPLVNQLLAGANGDSDWLENNLAAEISEWLTHNPSRDMGLELKAPHRVLKISSLGATGADNYLLRVVADDTPGHFEVLKQVFELTSRQAEVLYWICKGKTNSDIGQILGTSPRTVNKHSEIIYKKLDVENRTAAAAKSIHYLEH